MRVLVIGASGFIGRNFLLKTPNTWDVVGVYNTSVDFPDFIKMNKLNHVSACRCDFQDVGQVQKTFNKNNSKFDVCLYTAGNSDIGLSVRDPFFDLDSNVIGLINLLKNIKVGKFIYMSSGAVYLGHQGRVEELTPVFPIIPYGINKLCCELYIKYFKEYTDHVNEYVNLRFFGAYGPMEASRKIYTKLIKAIAINNEESFTISGDGQNVIDAMYVDDAILGLMKVIESKKANVTVDFCQGYVLTIDELVMRVVKILGKDNIAIKHVGITPEPIAFRGSPKEMKDLYSFVARIPLEKGIPQFAEFLQIPDS